MCGLATTAAATSATAHDEPLHRMCPPLFPQMGITFLHAFLLAWFGVLCRSLLNSWVRGTDINFHNALKVDQINAKGPVEWVDEVSQEPAMLLSDVGREVNIRGKALFVGGKRRRVRWHSTGMKHADYNVKAFKYAGLSGTIMSVDERVRGLVTLEGGRTFENPGLPLMEYSVNHEPGGIRLGDLAAEERNLRKHVIWPKPPYTQIYKTGNILQ